MIWSGPHCEKCGHSCPKGKEANRNENIVTQFLQALSLCVIDLNPCRRNPCLNGGMCTLERGHFLCLCSPPYQGETCDIGTIWQQQQQHNYTATGKTHKTYVAINTVVPECSYKNGGCWQYCKDLPGGTGVQCGCANGYKLHSDGRRCSKTGDVFTQKYFWFLTINQANQKHRRNQQTLIIVQQQHSTATTS